MNKKSLYIYLAVIIVLYFIAFHKSIVSLLSHGFTWHLTIPIITGYIIWYKRAELLASNFNPNFILGILFLVIGILSLFAGSTSSTIILTESALVFSIWSYILFTGGTKLFFQLMLPLLYLFLTSPELDSFFDSFSPFFRNGTAYLSYIFSNLFGYSVLYSHTYLRLPNMLLNVAEECSGIKHLLSLTAVVVPLAAINKRKSIYNILLLLITIPVALLSNSLRVLFIIIFNYNRQVFSHGPNNILTTSFGFFIGLFILCMIAYFTKSCIVKQQQINKKEMSLLILFPKKRFLIPIIITLATGSILLNFWQIKNPDSKPHMLNTMYDTKEIQILPISSIQQLDSFPVADLEGRYVVSNNNRNLFYAYIGWYSVQSQDKEVTGYNYDQYLIQRSIFKTTISDKEYAFRICETRQADSDFNYWIIYKSYKIYTCSPLFIKFLSTMDALFHRSTSASIMILVFPKTFSNELLNGTDSKNLHNFKLFMDIIVRRYK